MAIKIPLNCMEWASQTHLFVLKYLSQFFINFENQGQFWNLLVMRISKLSLICRFDKELTEIFKVKDITQSCSKNLMSGVGLSDPLPSVIELSSVDKFSN